AAAAGVDGAVPAAAPVVGAPVVVAPGRAEVGLLGPVCVRALGDIEASMVPLATEIVVYLAAHPGGAYSSALARAIWPQGVADEIRDGVLAAGARRPGTGGTRLPPRAARA